MKRPFDPSEEFLHPWVDLDPWVLTEPFDEKLRVRFKNPQLVEPASTLLLESLPMLQVSQMKQTKGVVEELPPDHGSRLPLLGPSHRLLHLITLDHLLEPFPQAPPTRDPPCIRQTAGAQEIAQQEGSSLCRLFEDTTGFGSPPLGILGQTPFKPFRKVVQPSTPCILHLSPYDLKNACSIRIGGRKIHVQPLDR